MEQYVSEKIIPRIFCVGLNYPEHISELKNFAPSAPVFFLKPLSCLVEPEKPIHFPSHGKVLHHEVEVVLRLGQSGSKIPESDALSYIDGVTVGLDLTLRDLQESLRKQSHPWEVSKSFDGAAPLGKIKPYNAKQSGPIDLNNLDFSCRVNNKIRQTGSTHDMIFKPGAIIHHLSRIWTLQPGDLIFTGTPPGVGPLVPGDFIEIESPPLGKFSWDIRI